jgi:hypothetical protein
MNSCHESRHRQTHVSCNTQAAAFNTNGTSRRTLSDRQRLVAGVTQTIGTQTRPNQTKPSPTLPLFRDPISHDKQQIGI